IALIGAMGIMLIVAACSTDGNISSESSPQVLAPPVEVLPPADTLATSHNPANEQTEPELPPTETQPGSDPASVQNTTDTTTPITTITPEPTSTPSTEVQHTQPSTAPHPFANALSEFFVNLAPVPDWVTPDTNTVMQNSSTHAILVDVDGNGAQGMLASKWTTDVQHYIPHSSAESLFVQRLFLLAGNQARPLIFDNMAVTPTGRLITMSNVDGQGILMRAYTLLGFNNGQLAPTKSIMVTEYGDWFRYLTGEGNDYFMVYNFVWEPSGEENKYAINYHTGEFWSRNTEQDQSITHAAFNELMTQYGLHDTTGFVWELQDETNAILSMSAQ
ncbi:MAG: hypothetical protein FWC91_07340, partial [Defluviitaleaceae bacterium]|nr:hypothetical protein [Defluviitaleaceae bacterium]